MRHLRIGVDQESAAAVSARIGLRQDWHRTEPWCRLSNRVRSVFVLQTTARRMRIIAWPDQGHWQPEDSRESVLLSKKPQP